MNAIPTPVEWCGDSLRILDQRALPHREEFLECRTVEQVAGAIRSLAVRGAPILGITAAFGVALAAVASRARETTTLLRDLERAGDALVATRPTAVNLRWAVARVLEVAREECSRVGATPAQVPEALVAEALHMVAEDREACAAMGRHGAELVPERANVLTHCNTGRLCTAGIGTALGVVYTVHERGTGVHVWVDETRPVLQGARLTAWELARAGVPMTLVADGAAAALMAAGRVDLVLVGADRIARNGDVANKIGTYGLAVLARHHGLPFYVVAPTSTVDLDTPSGRQIEIEERDPREVTRPLGLPLAPEGARALNPAFDVTPGELVTAIVTERGTLRPPFARSLARAVAGNGGGRERRASRLVCPGESEEP